jgi:hypothetical protein
LFSPSDDTQFFAREFGFTTEETVAIMGSHNLAAARDTVITCPFI